MAVDNMASLLEWGEAIVLGDADERNDEVAAVWRVVIAGMDLCDWLEDADGRDNIETLAIRIQLELGEDVGVSV